MTSTNFNGFYGGNGQNQDMNERLNNLERLLMDSQEKAKESSQRVSQQEAMIAAMRKQLAEKEQVIASHQKLLAEKKGLERRVDELAQELDASELSPHQEENETLREQVARLTTELELTFGELEQSRNANGVANKSLLQGPPSEREVELTNKVKELEQANSLLEEQSRRLNSELEHSRMAMSLLNANVSLRQQIGKLDAKRDKRRKQKKNLDHSPRSVEDEEQAELVFSVTECTTEGDVSAMDTGVSDDDCLTSEPGSDEDEKPTSAAAAAAKQMAMAPSGMRRRTSKKQENSPVVAAIVEEGAAGFGRRPADVIRVL